jgi:alpha-L-fucosidase
LNIPPNGKGLISSNDSVALIGFKNLLENSFKNNLVKGKQLSVVTANKLASAPQLNDGDATSFIKIDKPKSKVLVKFVKPTIVNCIVLQEAIQLGQTIAAFTVKFSTDKGVEELKGTTIGRKRILTFPAKNITRFTISFAGNSAPALLSEVEAYLFPGE